MRPESSKFEKKKNFGGHDLVYNEDLITNAYPIFTSARTVVRSNTSSNANTAATNQN